MSNAKSLEHPAVPNAASKSGTADSARRRFLVTLGVGSAGAVAATAGVLPAAATPQAISAPTDKDAAYQESEHVRDYYRTTRI